MNGLVADTIEVLGRPRNGIWFLSGFWHRVNELDEGNAVISGFQTPENRTVAWPPNEEAEKNHKDSTMFANDKSRQVRETANQRKN